MFGRWRSALLEERDQYRLSESQGFAAPLRSHLREARPSGQLDTASEILSLVLLHPRQAGGADRVSRQPLQAARREYAAGALRRVHGLLKTVSGSVFDPVPLEESGLRPPPLFPGSRLAARARKRAGTRDVLLHLLMQYLIVKSFSRR